MYLLVSTGLLVEIHHCMGRVAGAELHLFATASTTACGKCGMEKGLESRHCCKDEIKQVKISDDHQVSVWNHSLAADWVALPQPVFAWQPEYMDMPVQQAAWLAKPPPDLPQHETFFLSVFRI